MKSYFQRVIELNGKPQVYRVFGILSLLLMINFYMAMGRQAPRALAEIGLYLVAGLAGVIAHEWAHAAAATAAGDPIPRMEGRLSLNPKVHLDFIGSLAIVIIKAGWARPVRFSPYLYHRRPWTLAGVTLAGPAANFLFALLGAVSLKVLVELNLISVQLSRFESLDIFTASGLVAFFLVCLAKANSVIGIFNLIPIPPLDGGSLLMLAYTKDPSAASKVSGHGFFLLLLLLVFARVDTILANAGMEVVRILLVLTDYLV